jgi:hypothetical protein
MSDHVGLRESIALCAEDVSGYTKVRAAGISPDMTVGELVEGLVPKMGLPGADAGGRPVSYHARSDREGRHLHASEIVGDALEPDDRIVLQPNIQAG